jgi:hypothetical protein
MKPAVGGIPARGSRNSSMQDTAPGCLRASPEQSCTVSPAWPFDSRKATKPEAPSLKEPREAEGVYDDQ